MAVSCFEGRKRCSSVAICGVWLAVLVGVHGDCPSPPRLDYGELTEASLTVTAFPVGTNLTYQCRPGYIRMPGKTNSITCLATNAWSEIQEFCERRDCGSPGELINGEVALSLIPGTHVHDTKFGATATFTCNEGYKLIGRNVRICTATGWNNAVPTCEVVICASPPSIANGAHTDSDKTEFPYRNSVLYSCKDATFTLLGNPVLSCTKYGNWSGPPPTCTDSQCPPRYLPLVKDLTLETVFATRPKDICVTVSQSMSDNWDKMNLEDKYNHLQFRKLCLEMGL